MNAFRKYNKLLFFPITYNHETYVKDTRNQEIFLDKKKINGGTNEDITNFFRLKKGVKGIKDTILRNIKNLFKHEEEGKYYKAVRVNDFWSNNYIEYKSNCDKSRILSVEEYLDKNRPYLKSVNN